MRENRLSGSEGGGTEANQFLLPLSVRAPRFMHRLHLFRFNRHA